MKGWKKESNLGYRSYVKDCWNSFYPGKEQEFSSLKVFKEKKHETWQTQMKKVVDIRGEYIILIRGK